MDAPASPAGSAPASTEPAPGEAAGSSLAGEVRESALLLTLALLVTVGAALLCRALAGLSP
jgi:hypothetical protein